MFASLILLCVTIGVITVSILSSVPTRQTTDIIQSSNLDYFHENLINSTSTTAQTSLITNR